MTTGQCSALRATTFPRFSVGKCRLWRAPHVRHPLDVGKCRLWRAPHMRLVLCVLCCSVLMCVVACSVRTALVLVLRGLCRGGGLVGVFEHLTRCEIGAVLVASMPSASLAEAESPALPHLKSRARC